MRRTQLGSMLAVGAITVGALLAPAAGAQPIGERTIKAECRNAGGTYQSQGGGFSTCTYRDYYGEYHRDYYINGSYHRSD